MRFTQRLLFLTGALALLAAGLLQFSGYQLVHPYVWYLLGFFVFLTGFAHYLTHLGLKHDPENFSAYYFASMGLRMVFCIIVIFMYRYYTEENLVQFVFNFFMLYFIYTGFEIHALLSNLRRNSKKPL